MGNRITELNIGFTEILYGFFYGLKINRIFEGTFSMAENRYSYPVYCSHLPMVLVAFNRVTAIE